MSPQRTKYICPQIEYFAPDLVAVEHFAVCVMQSSLTGQFEHSGKVGSGLRLNLALENLFFIAIRLGLISSGLYR